MKQIQVSDKCADRIERYRDHKVGIYEGEMEGILETLHGLNNMLCYAKDSKEVAQFADEIARGIDKVLDYFDLVKLLVYECDFKEQGTVEVKPMED